jgi:tetratricopeptide (TPR) repeat protein/WD40 repeat protein
MCAWSPDGRTLAVSDGNGRRVDLYAFDRAPPGLRLVRRLEGRSNGGTNFRFNPAGDRLITRGWNGVVQLFDLASGRPLFFTPGLQTTSACSLQLDSSGSRLGAARVGSQEQQIGVWSVADGREYRALVHDGSGRRSCQGFPVVHPGNRLAALGLTDGLVLFDLETGRELGFVPIPGGAGDACFDGAGNLFINHNAGLFRWPVRPDRAQPGRMIVGPPERLPFPSGNRTVATSRDGRVNAQVIFRHGVRVSHPNLTQPHLLETNSGDWTSVSPDGRWVACGPHVVRVNVYDTATGRHVWHTPDDGHQYCRFSPDGHWLLTDNDGGRAYHVGTWEPGPQLGPGRPWDVSPDGGLAVVGLPDGVYRLVELPTGRELARLEDPEQIAAEAVFTPDGTRLVVHAADGLRVWDLRRLWKELLRLKLDWDVQPYPEAADVLPGPLEVRVVGAELLDPKKMAEFQRNRAILNVALHPLDGNAHFRLGKHLLDAGQPRLAYALLTAALVLRPDIDETFNLRAQAAYRLQRWADAAADASHFLERHADAHGVRRVRARSYYMAGRFADAVIDCTKLIRHDSRDPRLYDLRAACQQALDRAGLAKADGEQALALAPHDPMLLNNQAWRLATAPPEQRDPARALQLIQEAVRQRPKERSFLNTLGVVQYRSGQYPQAVATLEKSLQAGKGRFAAFDLFFLAVTPSSAPPPGRENTSARPASGGARRRTFRPLTSGS